jgi:hypothetical protein
VGEFGGGCLVVADYTLSKKTFDLSMAKVEEKMTPDSATDDSRRESMAFVYIHPPILSISAI